MNRYVRALVAPLALSIGITLCASTLTISTASAAPVTTTATSVAQATDVSTNKDRPKPRIKRPWSSGHINYLSSSYCGKANIVTPRYCINFSRSEQLYIAEASIAVAAVFICARVGFIGCAAATAVAVTAIRFLNNRGGICPSYNPILEVEWFPTPGGYAKCSDG